MTILQGLHGERLSSRASPSEKNKLKERYYRTDLRYRFGRYIDDVLVIKTDKQKVRRTYARVWGAFERSELPLNSSKSERLHRNKQVTVLGKEFERKKSLKPDPDKLRNLLNETTKAIEYFLRNMRKSQGILI